MTRRRFWSTIAVPFLAALAPRVAVEPVTRLITRAVPTVPPMCEVWKIMEHLVE
jgi:hypothetical protein